MIFFFPTIPTTEFILSSTHCIRLVWAASSSQRPGSSVLKMEMGPLQRSSCSSSTRSAADWQPQWILDAGRYPLQTHRCLQKTQANILDGHGNRHRDRAWQMQLQIGKISVFFFAENRVSGLSVVLSYIGFDHQIIILRCFLRFISPENSRLSLEKRAESQRKWSIYLYFGHRFLVLGKVILNFLRSLVFSPCRFGNKSNCRVTTET